MSTVFFGSIGTLADTSELQRTSFNEAFEAHGLDWVWEREDYQALLETAGGADRVAEYATSRGEEVDAQAVHRSKSELFRKHLGESDPAARPGVLETVAAAKAAGFKVALVTTTAAENVTSLLEALAPDLSRADFELVVDSSIVGASKPDPASYAFALEQLGEDARACVAVEDNLDGVAAAKAAGIPCVAFPGANNAGHDFAAAVERVDQLDFSQLRSFVASAS